MVLVEASHRGQGIGGRMLNAAIELAQSIGGETFGLDATDLGRPVYLKRGFLDVARIDRWLRPGRAGAVPVGNTKSEPLCDFTDVLNMDRQMAGVDRSALLRHLIAEPGTICDSTNGAGYAILRRGRVADHIGPVVAANEGAAELLLDRLLQRESLADRAILLDVPRGRLGEWLTNRGFTLSRELMRMQTEGAAPRLMGPNVFAVAGFELG
jgi:hypothetical protein